MDKNKSKVVFLFSGQGSHYRGMGKDLYVNSAIFRESLERNDILVQKLINRSVIHELYEIKDSVFSDLIVTHPAILCVELAMFHVINELGIQADYISGNSLGEFAAAVTAGVWTEEEAIETCIEQAKSILRSGVSGGMTAVINTNNSLINEVKECFGLFLASTNFNGHFTVSGNEINLTSFHSKLESLGINYQKLAIEYPFHSPLIEDGRFGYEYYAKANSKKFKAKPGFISSIDVEEIQYLTMEYFWKAISTYSNFSNLVSFFEKRGPCIYLDLGPSGTNATFVKYNLASVSQSKVFQVMTPFGQEIKQLEKIKTLFN